MFESLETILAWIISGGGAGILAYAGMDCLPLDAWTKPQKRALSFIMAGVIGVLAYLATVSMQYAPVCPDWRCWIEQVVQVIAVAIPVSQAIHGARDL